MAKDDETGIDAVSEDAKGATDDELAKRRAKAGSAAQRGEQQQVADPGDPEQGEEDDGQMFVWEQGRKVTLGTLIARGTVVEHAFVFGGKRLKGSGGLVAFDEDVLLVSRGRVGKTSLVPTRDDEERVTKVTIETHIAAKVVVPADSDEAMSLLAAVFEKRGMKAA